MTTKGRSYHDQMTIKWRCHESSWTNLTSRFEMVIKHDQAHHARHDQHGTVPFTIHSRLIQKHNFFRWYHGPSMVISWQIHDWAITSSLIKNRTTTRHSSHQHIITMFHGTIQHNTYYIHESFTTQMMLSKRAYQLENDLKTIWKRLDKSSSSVLKWCCTWCTYNVAHVQHHIWLGLNNTHHHATWLNGRR